MRSYTVTVAARSLVPAREERLLMPAPRPVATLREARAFLQRMRPTWLGSECLLPTESGFVGYVVDDEGVAALSIEFGRDGEEPIEHGREELEAMRSRR